MSEDKEFSCITAATLTRVLKDCSLDAEIGMVIGGMPFCIPVESISIRENAASEEVIAFNISQANLKTILNQGMQMLEEINE